MENTKRIWDLSVMVGDTDERSFKACEVASKRFTSSADMIREDGILALQLSAENGRTLSSRVFLESGSLVSKEDINWIFNDCSDCVEVINENKMDIDSVLFENDRRVYTLAMAKRERSFNTMGKSCTSAIDIVDMLIKSDAVMHFAMGSKGCFILLSLPSEIPLHVRTMLNVFMSGVDVVEVYQGQTEEIKRINIYKFESAISELLYTLMLHPDRNSRYSVDASGNNEVYSKKIQREINLTIDQMDLTPATYRMLKRNGIRTLYDLNQEWDSFDVIEGPTSTCIRELERKMRELQQDCEKECDVVPGEVTENGLSGMAQLDELIGLEAVKTQVKKIAYFAKMKKDLGSANDLSMSLNMAFVGNPGTAKTTVARIAAKIFYDIGLLSSEDIVEAGRADLIAMYAGQTAGKVRALFEKAKGKVLFIDEAYSLLDDGNGQYGDEAINALVQEMENRRDETVVILAGYPTEMEELLTRNPGLKSRVPFKIKFNDYSVEDLVEIAKTEASGRGFKLSSDSVKKVRAFCSQAAKNPAAGNGRFSRNLIENALINYASRVYCKNDGNLSAETPKLILKPADIMLPSGIKSETEKRPIGFRI